MSKLRLSEIWDLRCRVMLLYQSACKVSPAAAELLKATARALEAEGEALHKELNQ